MNLDATTSSGNHYNTREKNSTYGADVQKSWQQGKKTNYILGVDLQHARTSSSASDHHLADSCDLTVTLSYRPTDVDTIKLIGRNLLNRQDPINNYEYYCTPASFTLTYDRKF